MKQNGCMAQSPWRYPGGKGKMAPGILPLIPEDTVRYCEPFIGGGGVTVPLLDRSYKLSVSMDLTLNDADSRVSSWWEVVADTSSNDFAGLLGMLELVPATLHTHGKCHVWGLDPNECRLIRAFSGIFLSRCSYSGILSAGPIGGKNQTSKYTVGCRWNPEALLTNHRAVRDLLVNHLDHQVTVLSQDFRSVIKGVDDAFIYADPPYKDMGSMKTTGNQLYPMPFTEADHEDLSTLLLGRDRWLLSYNDHPWVRHRYAKCRIEPVTTYYTVTNKRDNKIIGKELLIHPG